MQFEDNLNISVLIITLNEEQNLLELLPELDFASEIIIVDSFSTDNTKKVASSFEKVRFFEKKFENYSSQRNFALEQSSNDWILFIDADERLTPELKNEILTISASGSQTAAFFIYRKFFFKKKPLHFSGWQTDKVHRLFKKSKAHYTTKRLVHEKLEVNGSTAKLKNKIIHFSYTDYDSYKQKMVSYGRLKAREKFIAGFKPTFYHFYFHSVYSFLYNYIIRLGVLDGRNGLIICYLNALSVSARYKELERLDKNEK